MRPPRLALLLGALVVPALPLLVAAPAHAAGTICVNVAPADCAGGTTAASIPAAILAATGGTTIKVGPGSYTDGPYVLPPGVNLSGNGRGTSATATVLSLPAGAQTYLTVNGGTVSGVRVSMTTGNGATGIAASGSAIVDSVIVFGVGSTGSTGIQTQGSTLHVADVNMTVGTGNTAVRSLGGNLLLSESTWNGGATGYLLTAGNDTVSRVTVNPDATAVDVRAGSLSIDDSVLDLGATGTTGLAARPTAAGDTSTVQANHLTVVGGVGGSRGLVADASDADTGQSATLTVTNSVVRGPATSLVRVAGSGGETSSLSVSRSNYQTTSAGVTDGGSNIVGADPLFIDPAGANYALRAGSPLIDKAAASAASQDRLGNDRTFDGDGNGIAEPDMGAFELRDITPPSTVVTGGPKGPTNDNTPVFTFRSGADATFQCALDGGGFQSCSSPTTTTVLPDGPHTFTVRAVDPVFNLEPNPPTLSFTVDTKVPDTALTKKPQKRFYKPGVKFKFVSTEAGAKFQCQLDELPWRTCASPFRYSVKVGKHRLLVRAVDAAGNTDTSPARYKFKRVAKPRHHHR